MNRFIPYLNFIGVLVLAGICVTQWRQNRTLNLEVNQMQRTHQQETQKIAEQEKSIRGLTTDLTVLKEQFGQSHSNLTATRASLHKLEGASRQSALERDQLKESVTNWAAAVTARDERIQTANQEILSLSGQLNASIRKYNTLASNYNSTVKQLDEVRQRLQSIPRPANKN